MVLPFLAAAMVVYLYLSIVLFRTADFVPPIIELPDRDVGGDGIGINRPSTALIDKAGAIFGSILLIATLGALVGTSTVGIPVWKVAVPAAVMMVGHDLLRDWYCHHAHRDVAEERGHERRDTSPPSALHPPIELRELPLSASPIDGHNPGHNSRGQLALSTVLSKWINRLAQTFPTVYTVCRQLPLTLVPFAFLMFILVQGLASQGWVHVFARWWGTWSNRTGVIGAVGGMVIGSGLLCNVCQPLSFFFSVLTSSGVCNHHVTTDMWHKYWHGHSFSADVTGMGVCRAT